MLFETVENIDAYHAARGNSDWAQVSAADRLAFATRATDYVSRSFEYDGEPETPGGLAWPRIQAYWPNGDLVEGIPAPVKEATAMAADYYRQGIDLDGVLDTGGRVTERKVDVLTTKFDVRVSPTAAVATPLIKLLQSSGLLVGASSGSVSRV